MGRNVLMQVVSFAARLKVHKFRPRHFSLVDKIIIIKLKAKKTVEFLKPLITVVKNIPVNYFYVVFFKNDL